MEYRPSGARAREASERGADKRETCVGDGPGAVATTGRRARTRQPAQAASYAHGSDASDDGLTPSRVTAAPQARQRRQTATTQPSSGRTDPSDAAEFIFLLEQLARQGPDRRAFTSSVVNPPGTTRPPSSPASAPLVWAFRGSARKQAVARRLEHASTVSTRSFTLTHTRFFNFFFLFSNLSFFWRRSLQTRPSTRDVPSIRSTTSPRARTVRSCCRADRDAAARAFGVPREKFTRTVAPVRELYEAKPGRARRIPRSFLVGARAPCVRF